MELYFDKQVVTHGKQPGMYVPKVMFPFFSAKTDDAPASRVIVTRRNIIDDVGFPATVAKTGSDQRIVHVPLDHRKEFPIGTSVRVSLFGRLK